MGDQSLFSAAGRSQMENKMPSIKIHAKTAWWPHFPYIGPRCSVPKIAGKPSRKSHQTQQKPEIHHNAPQTPAKRG
jgi:hypothetical protein